MWTFKATMPQHAMFYLDGNGACVMLGRQHFILLAIFVVGSIYLGLIRKRVQTLNAIAYAAVIFVAYLIPTLNWQKTQFFGVVFHLMLIFSALLIMRHVIEVARARLASAGWRPDGYGFRRNISPFVPMAAVPKSRRHRALELTQAHYRPNHVAIVEHTGQLPCTAMLTTAGYVSSDLFNYLALQRGILLSFDNRATSGDLQVHRTAWSKADFVIAAQRDNSESVNYIPSYAIQDQLLSTLHSSPAFVQIAAVPTLNGKCFFAFQNVRRMQLRDSSPKLRRHSWSP